MTSSKPTAHLEIDRLEDRVVPDASALDPDFFNRLNFDAYDQANQQMQDRVRVYSGLYQQGQTAVQDANSAIQNGQNQAISDAQAKILELTKAFQDLNKQIQDYKTAVENRYKDNVGDLQNQAQSMINQVAQSGVDPATGAAATGVILAWTRAQYENLTKGVEFQMQEVLTAYNWMQQAQKDQFASEVNNAIAKFNQLQAVREQMLLAYDSYNVALLNQFQAELNRIQQELIQKLNDIQNLFLNYSELVTQQQLQSGFSGGERLFIDESAGSGYSDYGGSRFGYDDDAPKGY